MNASRMTLFTRITTLALATSLLAASPTLAQSRYAVYDSFLSDAEVREVEPEGDDEVEVKNDVGTPLRVEVDDRQPIQVILRPGNASYLVESTMRLSDSTHDIDFVTEQAPVDSHLRGVTVTVHSSEEIARCGVNVYLPTDDDQRSPFQAEPMIAKVRFSRTLGATQHLPLPDLFVPEGGELGFYFERETPGGWCDLTVLVHMRPLDIAVAGPSDFGIGF